MDTILAAHQIDPNHIYQLGARLTPVAIRDQMVRACLLIDRALASSIIHGADRPLLIIGGGAAGVTAAIRAAAGGVHVALVEREPELFTRQAECDRWIDPVQYDWPAAHWADETTTITYENAAAARATGNDGRATVMPLEWKANRANELSLEWAQRTRDVEDDAGHLHILRSWECQKVFTYDEKERWKVSIQYAGVGEPPSRDLDFLRDNLDVSPARKYSALLRSYAMIILCIGVGENCTINDFRGHYFWESDGLEAPKPDLVNGTVLIAGGGDGALQDFLRVTTPVPSARALAFALFQEQLQVLDTLANMLSWHEDQFQRAYLWGAEGADHEALCMLEDAYRNAVDWLCSQTKVWDSIQSKLDVLTAGRPRNVKLVHSCQHFGKVYPLNHLLTRVVARYLEQGRDNVLLGGYRASSVTGQHGHVCNHNPSDCLGKPHLVGLSASTCMAKRGSVSMEIDDVKVVLLRLGLQKLSEKARRLYAPIGRQALPYHVYSNKLRQYAHFKQPG